MKLVSFSTADGRLRPGALTGDTVLDLSFAFPDTLAVIAAGLVANGANFRSTVQSTQFCIWPWLC